MLGAPSLSSQDIATSLGVLLMFTSHNNGPLDLDGTLCTSFLDLLF